MKAKKLMMSIFYTRVTAISNESISNYYFKVGAGINDKLSMKCSDVYVQAYTGFVSWKIPYNKFK